MLADNFHNYTEETYKVSVAFLNEQPDLKAKLEDSLWAFYSLGKLIPETLEKFASGHYFPYSESFFNLRSSLELCRYGFYSQALVSLRSVLELSTMGIYYDINDESHVTVKPWIQSTIRTPSFKLMINTLLQKDYYKRFDKIFGLGKELENLYDELGGFVHVRGYKSSSTGLSGSNIIVFKPKILEKFVKKQVQVVILVSILMLLKYPIGIVPLPITDKFGFNGLSGGFLEKIDTDHILAMLTKEEVVFMQNIAKNDTHVQETVRYFENLPEIDGEEFQRQANEWGHFMEEHKRDPE